MRFPGFEGEWEKYNINGIFKIGSGKDYKHLEKGKIPVFGTGGYITSVNKYLYDGETVCIGRKGTINNPFFYKGKLWTVDTLFYTHSFNMVLPKFVFYLAENINWLKYNEASGVPSLSKKTIEKINVIIPAINEQKKINSFLTSIDERIQVSNKIIKELSVLKSGVSKKIFFREWRLKDENGIEFPMWKKMKLRDITIKKSSNIAANKIEDNFGKYIIYGASGILKYVDFYEEENDYIGIVKDGAGVGRIFYCKGKSSVLATMDIIKPEKNLNTYFLYCLLDRINYKKYITGSTIPHIYFKDYRVEKVGVPCLEEQTKIANFLSSIDTKIDVEAQLLQKLEEQKKYLLQHLFC